MALDQETQNAITQAVAEGIRQGLSGHACRIPISDSQAKEMGHAVGMIVDLGGGGDRGLPQGIEAIRENHKWMTKMRKRSDALGMVIMGTFITLTVGGLGTALWAGIKYLVRVEE